MAAGRNADGRLEYFATTGDIDHDWQLAPNGTSGWSGLSPFTSDTDFSSVAVGSDADGRLEVFATGSDGGIYHAWQLTPNGTSGWSAFYPLASAAGSYFSSVAAATDADGRLEVFAIDDVGGGTYHDWQLAPNGTTGWSGLQPLDPGNSFATIAAGTNADGRLEVFVTRSDDVIYHDWQVAPNGTSGWSGFSSLGQTNGVDSISVAANADGRLELFFDTANSYSSPNNIVYHDWQVAPNGTSGWSGFYPLAPTTTFGPIAAATNADGRLEVFASYLQDGYSHDWQVAPEGIAGWSGFYQLGIAG